MKDRGRQGEGLLIYFQYYVKRFSPENYQLSEACQLSLIRFAKVLPTA
jgi:hypothetical protein